MRAAIGQLDVELARPDVLAGLKHQAIGANVLQEKVALALAGDIALTLRNTTAREVLISIPP